MAHLCYTCMVFLLICLHPLTSQMTDSCFTPAPHSLFAEECVVECMSWTLSLLPWLVGGDMSARNWNSSISLECKIEKQEVSQQDMCSHSRGTVKERSKNAWAACFAAPRQWWQLQLRIQEVLGNRQILCCNQIDLLTEAAVPFL